MVLKHSNLFPLEYYFGCAPCNGDKERQLASVQAENPPGQMIYSCCGFHSAPTWLALLASPSIALFISPAEVVSVVIEMDCSPATTGTQIQSASNLFLEPRRSFCRCPSTRGSLTNLTHEMKQSIFLQTAQMTICSNGMSAGQRRWWHHIRLFWYRKRLNFFF